ncbi:MAG: hypothetical protein PHQ11_06250 [Paludibacter sp.]|nr:hypothetical protein [Paludibacter sp.]MDD4427806.1 hypothetical protein [Paludibacter sp.]
MLVFSQENKFEKRSFPMYADYVSEIYNINCKIPENFTDLKFLEILKISEINTLYCPVIQSDDNECILMYDPMPRYGFMMSEIIKGEIGQMLNLNCCNNSITDTINIHHYTTIITGNYARNSFNADSVAFLNIPLRSAYKEKFNYCTDMFISKKEHACMVLKWFFTEIGEKNKEKYIKSLSKDIWYNAGVWTYNEEKRDSTILNFLGTIIRDTNQN